MFRSLMTTIREIFPHLTKVIFMLKHSVKLRRYIYSRVCTALNTTHMPLYDMLPHHLIHLTT